MTVVTIHQPNYVPALSVVEKVEAADIVVWLDDVAFSRGSYTNRNVMTDGSYLTVPVDHRTLDGPIRDVKISDHRGWARRHVRTIHQNYGSTPVIDAACLLISHRDHSPDLSLVSLNLALLSLLIRRPRKGWFVQSELGLPAVDDASERLARLVEYVGGTEYLSGQSGRLYLNERPFRARDIAVRYMEPRAVNPCVLSRYAERVTT